LVRALGITSSLWIIPGGFPAKYRDKEELGTKKADKRELHLTLSTVKLMDILGLTGLSQEIRHIIPKSKD
jgi:hypothetical protein